MNTALDGQNKPRELDVRTPHSFALRGGGRVSGSLPAEIGKFIFANGTLLDFTFGPNEIFRLKKPRRLDTLRSFAWRGRRTWRREWTGRGRSEGNRRRMRASSKTRCVWRATSKHTNTTLGVYQYKDHLVFIFMSKRSSYFQPKVVHT